jgi:hypothetical protein
MCPTPAIGAAEVAVDLPPEPVHFRELLLADHFNDLIGAEADAPPSGDTTFEQLECIGYQPQLKQLNAVIELKQSSGDSGGIYTGGSTAPDDDKKTAELKAKPERCVGGIPW